MRVNREALDRTMPDVAVGSYVASGLAALGAAGVMLDLVPVTPVVLAFFHYGPPVFALGAGAATAAAPSHRMPHRLFWVSAGVFLAWPLLGFAGVHMSQVVEIALRLGYGAGMLAGGGAWLRDRRALRAPDPLGRLTP